MLTKKRRKIALEGFVYWNNNGPDKIFPSGGRTFPDTVAIFPNRITEKDKLEAVKHSYGKKGHSQAKLKEIAKKHFDIFGLLVEKYGTDISELLRGLHKKKIRFEITVINGTLPVKNPRKLRCDEFYAPDGAIVRFTSRHKKMADEAEKRAMNELEETQREKCKTVGDVKIR